MCTLQGPALAPGSLLEAENSSQLKVLGIQQLGCPPYLGSHGYVPGSYCLAFGTVAQFQH